MAKPPYWHDESYLNAICRKASGYRKTLRSSQGYPAMLMQKPGKPAHIACPPGFLSPGSAEAFRIFLNDVADAAQAEGAATAFLQYRGGRSDEIVEIISASARDFNCENRGAVHIDVSGAEGDMLARCRRDTRQRLKQMYDIKTVRRHDPLFDKFYERIAEERNFSGIYRYTPDDLKIMTDAEGIAPVSFYAADNQYIGGAVLGHADEGLCDYILSAYHADIPNAGRAVLWGSLLAAQNMGYSRVNLGGGVQENDPLFDFKMSFGGIPAPFTTVKIIFDTEAYCAAYRPGKKNIDFTGFFP